MTVADLTLTKRQREVLMRFLDGRPVAAIARELRCTESNVRKHLADIAADLPDKHPPMRRLLIYGAELLAEGS